MGGGTEHTACTSAGSAEGAGDAAAAEGCRRKAPPARIPLCLLVPFLLLTCVGGMSLLRRRLLPEGVQTGRTYVDASSCHGKTYQKKYSREELSVPSLQYKVCPQRLHERAHTRGDAFSDQKHCKGYSEQGTKAWHRQQRQKHQTE